MKHEHSYHIETIKLLTHAGETIHKMKRDACMAALIHMCDVEFIHNDRPYRVNADALVDCVKEQEKASR